MSRRGTPACSAGFRGRRMHLPTASAQRCKDMEPSKDSALLQEALGLHRQGRLDEAVSRYRQVVGREPANADAHYHLAMAPCEQGRLIEGIDFAQKSLALDPKQARAHRLVGLALTHLGRPA